MRSDALRPDGWTSADAAGLPILPGLVRGAEVKAGVIDHALRFTVPQHVRRAHPPGPPRRRNGQRAVAAADGHARTAEGVVRLVAALAAARVIDQAMKKYGMILADNGSAWYVSGYSSSCVRRRRPAHAEPHHRRRPGGRRHVRCRERLSGTPRKVEAGGGRLSAPWEWVDPRWQQAGLRTDGGLNHDPAVPHSAHRPDAPALQAAALARRLLRQPRPPRPLRRQGPRPLGAGAADAIPHDGSGRRRATVNHQPIAPLDEWGHDCLWWLDRMVRSRATSWSSG